MQRYRVNYVLLVSLVVGFFASAGAAYGLWKFQIERNAGRLLDKTAKAETSGDTLQAFESLEQYVQLRTKDMDARRRLGELAIKAAELPDVANDFRGRAYRTAVDAVLTTNDAKLRRQLVDLQTKFGMADLALININQLLDGGHSDDELKALKAECLFATKKSSDAEKWCYDLIGYDKKTDAFVPEKAQTPKIPRVYALLAQYLRSIKQPELSARVLDQMIAVNPEAREAYIAHYQFLKVDGKNEEARAALEKAFALDPTDAAVLTLKGVEAVVDFQTDVAATGDGADEKRKAAGKHLDDAAKFFSDALAKYPDRMDLYERAARVEIFREQPEKALEVLKGGLEKFPLKEGSEASGLPRAIHLSNLKVEILVGQKNFDAVREEIKTLRSLNNTRLTAVADFHEARLLAIDEKWAEAAAAMKSVRSRLVGFPELQGLAGAIQGFAHTQLGQFDLAREAYQWALERNPQLPQARQGVAEMRRILEPGAEDGEAVALDAKIKAMMARPAEEQDWDAVFADIALYIAQQAENRPVAPTWADSRQALMRGQVFAMRATVETDETKKRELFKEARNEILKAYKIDPKDPQIQLAAIRLLAQDPDSGPVKALKQLDKVVSEGEDSAPFRTLRIDLLHAIGGEQLLSQLEAATQGMESWDPNQQAVVWSAVGTKFEQLGKFADAKRALEKAVELAPNSLPFRMALFDLSLKQADDAGMRAAQARVLEIVKNVDDPSYVLTEVKRRIVGSASGVVSKEELTEARTMLNAAIKVRDTWSELQVASGQLYLVLENDVDRALAAFDAAQELGATNLNATALQVRLLGERGRLAEARQRMARIPEPMWSVILDRTAADLLLLSGEAEKALTEAEKVAKSRPDDAATQVWFGEVAVRAQKPEQALVAYQRAVELNPSDPDNWTRLVSVLIQLKRGDDVERTLREAHLALDEEFLPLLSAKYYELQSRWQQAEDIYMSAYANHMDEPAIARRLAEFYLTWSKDNPGNRGKAATYINKILKATYEGKLPAEDAMALWARRQAARLLATTGKYTDSVKAEKMLAGAAAGEKASIEDKEQLIDLLSLRNDPGSRERVVSMLREIKQQRGLPAMRELQLGHMLNEINDWEASKKQMEDAIGRYPDDIGLQTAYASMFIARKDFSSAKTWIARLANNREAANSVQELRLRLAAAQGNKDEVRRVLTGMTPNLAVVTPEQLQFVRSVALLADSVGDHEYALNLFREYARRSPGSELPLARLTALYGDLDEGLAMLDGQLEAQMDDVILVMLEVLRKRRADAPEKLDAALTRMVQAALRDDPESASRLLQQAEMLEVQEKFQESIDAYNKLLARDDVPAQLRATALNNRAFLLALKSDKPEDMELALRSANEAVEILGPISDILDTRALVYLASGQFEQAVADMKLSVMVGPTASKYYHLAAAELAAGNEPAAKAAWERAVTDGIGPEAVSQLERADLEEFTKKMQSLGGATPTAQL